MKTANAIREVIACTFTDWSRCNYARQGGRSIGRLGGQTKVLNSPDVYAVRERASPILAGSRHKSDRIFIDAKLAISSPVTIPELCISLGDSRSKVYPSRLFPTRTPDRSSALFHAENFLPFPPPPRPLPPLPDPRSLLAVSSTLLHNPLVALYVTSHSLVELLPPFEFPTYPPHPFSARKRHLLVEREGGKRDDILESDQSR